jgi:hypothetical protein
MAKVQVISLAETTDTPVAAIPGLPEFTSCTVAPERKLLPVSPVTATEVPVYPVSGVIPRTFGPEAAEVAEVGVTVDDERVVAAGTGVAVTAGVPIGMEDNAILVTFTVYTFSIVILLTESVLESIRYPQLPSLLG